MFHPALRLFAVLQDATCELLGFRIALALDSYLCCRCLVVCMHCCSFLFRLLLGRPCSLALVVLIRWFAFLQSCVIASHVPHLFLLVAVAVSQQ